MMRRFGFAVLRPGLSRDHCSRTAGWWDDGRRSRGCGKGNNGCLAGDDGRAVGMHPGSRVDNFRLQDRLPFHHVLDVARLQWSSVAARGKQAQGHGSKTTLHCDSRVCSII